MTCLRDVMSKPNPTVPSLLPHGSLLHNRVSMQVLLHTAQCPASAHAIVTAAEIVDVLVDVVQLFRDNLALFGPALRLLAQVVGHEPTRLAMKANKAVMKQLTGVANIMNRKAAMHRATPASGSGGKSDDSVDDALARLSDLLAKLEA